MDTLRNYSITKINEIINNPEISKQIEEGIYDYSIERLDDVGYKGEEDLPLEAVNFMYKQNFIKVINNIENSYELAMEDPYHYVFKKREELDPNKWEQLYKNRTQDIVKKKGLYKCPRCKSFYTEYIEVQTRSADEAATIKISCECGYRWKLN